MEEIKKTRKKGKKWLIALIVVIAVLLAIVIGTWAAVSSFLGQMTFDDPYEKSETDGDLLQGTTSQIYEGDGDLPEPLPGFTPITDNEEVMEKEGEHTPFDMTRLSELQDALRRWCANGTPVTSKKVTNILLIGMDNDNLAQNARADVMVLLSINTETKQIVLTSFLRDAYTYVTDGQQEIFEKMHLSNTRGGPNLLIETIEKHYKVQIDNYVIANMSTFPTIVDMVGGIEMDLNAAEAEVLKLDPGKQLLDGEDALKYARLRRIDSDVDRTGRHRAVLLALFDKVKTSSSDELWDLLNAMLPCIRTGMTKTEIVAMGTKAITGGWFTFQTVTQSFPLEEQRVSATIDDLFYWITDYPHAAHDLQMSIYGTSNIHLE